MSIPLCRKQIATASDQETFKETCWLHHQLHTGERLAYHNNKSIAKKSSEWVMSMVIDCPCSYDLSSIVPVIKETSTLPKVEFNSVDTISHHSHMRDFYWYLLSFVKNTNLIITPRLWYQ
jgi:hypothetical protein